MSAPGWYPDPAGGPGQRYFDGTQWTGARRPSEPPPPGRGLGSGAKIAIGVAVALAALLVLGIVTSEAPDDTESAEPATTSAPATPRPPLGSIAEDGTYKVDDCFGCRPDPGTWQSDGGVGKDYCIWMRRTDMRIGADNIIERGEAAPNERVRVALKLGEYFTTLGCQPWTFVG